MGGPAPQVRLTRPVAGPICVVRRGPPPLARGEADDHRGVAAAPRHVEAIAGDMAELVQEDGLEVDLAARRVVRALLPGEVAAEDQVTLARPVAPAPAEHGDR